MFSWLIEMLIGDLPVWLWPFTAGVGIVIYFFSGIATHFPNIKPYAMFVKPVAFITFCLGIFMYGGAGVNAINQAAIKLAEERVKMAEEVSKTANQQLAEKLKNAQSVIKEQENRLAMSIMKNKKKLDAECNIDPLALKLYNRAVTNGQAVVPKK